jgi:hypothetical protein
MDRLWQMNGWLAREARFLDTNLELFRQFCMKLLELGVLLDRSWLHIRALHPQYAGMARLWTRETGVEERYLDHGFEETSTYLTSPVRFTVEGREPGRWRLDAAAALPFPLLDELRAAGYADYAIAPLLYSDGTANALSWATRAAGGFDDDDLQLFHDLLPDFAAIAEIKSLRRFAANMLRTYVGREPGELILKGQIRRGDVRTITAALMLVDLRDFRLMSDMMAPNAVIETLNGYFDCVMLPVNRHCGEVMEIMGDGILAIFNESVEGGPDAACRQAFEAAKAGSTRSRAGINPGPTAHPISSRASRCITARSPMAISARAIGSISRSSAVTSISRAGSSDSAASSASNSSCRANSWPACRSRCSRSGILRCEESRRCSSFSACRPPRDLGSSSIRTLKARPHTDSHTCCNQTRPTDPR